MAEFDSDQYAKLDGNTVPEAHEYSGELRVAYFKYTADGTEAASDTVNLTTLPKGARVLPGDLHVDALDATADGATTASTIRVGDSDDDDRYLAATSVDTAYDGKINDTDEAGFCHVLTAATDIVLTFDAADVASGDVIEGYLVYVPVG